jgi:hypothetical protein
MGLRVACYGFQVESFECGVQASFASHLRNFNGFNTPAQMYMVSRDGGGGFLGSAARMGLYLFIVDVTV